MTTISIFIRIATANVGRRVGGRFREERGASAVEFALIAPIFCFILAGAADFGGLLYVKFGLDDAVSAAADYALVNAASVDSSSGSTLASNLAAIVGGSRATNWATGTVVVNDGPTATVNSSGAVTSSGTAGNADSCYCPTQGSSSLTWGAAATCGSACAGGGVAGKFVTIVASKAYTPLFSSYGIVKNGTVSASAVAETQ